MSLRIQQTASTPKALPSIDFSSSISQVYHLIQSSFTTLQQTASTTLQMPKTTALKAFAACKDSALNHPKKTACLSGTGTLFAIYKIYQYLNPPVKIPPSPVFGNLLVSLVVAVGIGAAATYANNRRSKAPPPAEPKEEDLSVDSIIEETTKPVNTDLSTTEDKVADPAVLPPPTETKRGPPNASQYQQVHIQGYQEKLESCAELLQNGQSIPNNHPKQEEYVTILGNMRVAIETAIQETKNEDLSQADCLGTMGTRRNRLHDDLNKYADRIEQIKDLLREENIIIDPREKKKMESERKAQTLPQKLKSVFSFLTGSSKI